MKHFVLYDVTGGIKQTCMCDDQSFEGWKAPSGQTLLELTAPPDNPITFPQQNYVLNGTVTARGTIAPAVSAGTIASDGTTVSTITGLPDPCTVSIAGPQTVAPTVVNGGTIILTSNAPGTITVSVAAEPAYLPWSTTINAV